MEMRDVQSSPAEVDMPIDRVGVKGLRLPLVVRDRSHGRQHTVASVDMSVDLPGAFKGTHMSRFVEALENWSGELDYSTHRELLGDVRDRLKARSAHVRFRFPYFMEQTSPRSACSGLMSYDCEVEGELKGDTLTLTIGVDVPVMTVCPCSLAISDTGAHSQRANVGIRARFSRFVWIEELIAVAEESASSKVYTLLKREDEKHVTESAFDNPAFVEDVVRHAAHRLDSMARLTWFKVEVESYESIHSHNAYAMIERSKDSG